ncbi:MAG: hypothetical protein SFZ03_11905 [Candidatus Melainabacteria bacterium]|nr:hypothetical protein [Candidatus Melainabacteria bacterium]
MPGYGLPPIPGGGGFLPPPSLPGSVKLPPGDTGGQTPPGTGLPLPDGSYDYLDRFRYREPYEVSSLGADAYYRQFGPESSYQRETAGEKAHEFHKPINPLPRPFDTDPWPDHFDPQGQQNFDPVTAHWSSMSKQMTYDTENSGQWSQHHPVQNTSPLPRWFESNEWPDESSEVSLALTPEWSTLPHDWDTYVSPSDPYYMIEQYKIYYNLYRNHRNPFKNITLSDDNVDFQTQ